MLMCDFLGKTISASPIVTFWINESAIEKWNCPTHHGARGRGFIYSDTAIETALMVKKVFGEGEWKVKKVR